MEYESGMSHHKAYEIMVSGEVICYSPKGQSSLSLVSKVEPRVVFEMWLFQRFYSHTDPIETAKYCLDNSNRLRPILKEREIVTRFNDGSFITILDGYRLGWSKISTQHPKETEYVRTFRSHSFLDLESQDMSQESLLSRSSLKISRILHTDHKE